jgi:hypothetical protein
MRCREDPAKRRFLAGMLATHGVEAAFHLRMLRVPAPIEALEVLSEVDCTGCESLTEMMNEPSDSSIDAVTSFCLPVNV